MASSFKFRPSPMSSPMLLNLLSILLSPTNQLAAKNKKKGQASRELRKQCRLLQKVVKQGRAPSLLKDFFWAALYTGLNVICRALIKGLHQVSTQKHQHEKKAYTHVHVHVYTHTHTKHPKSSSPQRKVQYNCYRLIFYPKCKKLRGVSLQKNRFLLDHLFSLLRDLS